MTVTSTVHWRPAQTFHPSSTSTPCPAEDADGSRGAAGGLFENAADRTNGRPNSTIRSIAAQPLERDTCGEAIPDALAVNMVESHVHTISDLSVWYFELCLVFRIEAPFGSEPHAQQEISGRNLHTLEIRLPLSDPFASISA